MPPLFAESDEGSLKAWLVRRLVSASEADPDVLADYILALLRHDQGRDDIMETCISQLADFMSSGLDPPSVSFFVDIPFSVLSFGIDE
jgi:hypothetical protein